MVLQNIIINPATKSVTFNQLRSENMHPRRQRRTLFGLLLYTTLLAHLSTSAAITPQSIDYLSLAQGAIPVAIEDPTDSLHVGMDKALAIIDGNDAGFVLTPKPGTADTELAFIFKLPAMTTFSAFTIPNVGETPSPSQTFIKSVTILGSDTNQAGPYTLLARSMLTTHTKQGESTHITAIAEQPVRWVRLVLKGGINVLREKIFFEFSELKGFGSQQPVPLSKEFHGKWKGRGVLLELLQDEGRVTGCYDRMGDLQGSITGNVLRATGRDRNSGIPSTFVLMVDEAANIFGVRSTNGAPFRLYTGATAPRLVTECSERLVAPPGCGSIIHGINFDFDSALIRPDSEDLLNAIVSGLNAARPGGITIMGHTSSEGSEAYNLDLSKRRAQAVVDAIMVRGLESKSISAEGRGENEPIADNSTDAGRALNRRVEIVCH